MRILIDANVYLSYLLNPLGHGAATQVVSLVGEGRFELIFPVDTEIELRRIATTKPYLRERIAEVQLETLIIALRDVAVSLNAASRPAPISSRDPNDTFLLEIAFAGNADYLVSGDRDLLVLSPLIPYPRIVTPAEFLEVLRSSEAGQS
jgi:putative PIN family toxin of toxin-antitoxin system